MISEVKTTFTRVFDIAPGQARGRRGGTVFSFEHAGGIEYGVAIAGKPALRSGMTVTAILEEPGNWQTLVGWIDHDTREIACESRAALLLPLAAVPAVAGGTFLSGQRAPLLTGLVALAVGSLLAYGVGDAWTIFKARSRLDALQEQLIRASRRPTPQA